MRCGRARSTRCCDASVTRGFLPAGLDLDMEAAVLARLVDGLGLRAWLSGSWEQARSLLIGHLASLGLPLRLVAGLAAEGAGVPP